MTPAPFSPALLALFVGMGIATSTDLRSGRIPNALTGSMMVLGLVFALVQGAVVDAIFGIGLAFAIHFPLWLLRVVKAGDVKLLMGAGALVGPALVLEITVWCALLYLPVGLAMLAFQGRLGNIAATVKWGVSMARGVHMARPEPTMLRTAPVIAAASLAAVSTSWFDLTW